MGGGRSNLIGCRGIGAGVSSQAGQLLLHAEVGALAHAEEGGGHGQRHQDEEHAEDGEQQELARLHPGLLHHRDLSQAAPLKETEKRLLSSGGKTGRKKKKNTNCHACVVSFINGKISPAPPDPPVHLPNIAALTSSSIATLASIHRHCLTRPHSLTSPNSGLIVCIYTQSAPITGPCPLCGHHYRYLQPYLALACGGLATRGSCRRPGH